MNLPTSVAERIKERAPIDWFGARCHAGEALSLTLIVAGDSIRSRGESQVKA